MSAVPELPPDYNEQFDQMVDRFPFSWKTLGLLIREYRAASVLASEDLTNKLEALEAPADEYKFHEVDTGEELVRVAITPPDERYRHLASPVWRIIVNEGRTVYSNQKPKEQWDTTDVLVQPFINRIAVQQARQISVRGYGDYAPLALGTPPRIIRDSQSGLYTLRHAKGYAHDLPNIPRLSRKSQTRYYWNYAVEIGSLAERLDLLNTSTEVDAALDLQQEDDE